MEVTTNIFPQEFVQRYHVDWKPQNQQQQTQTGENMPASTFCPEPPMMMDRSRSESMTSSHSSSPPRDPSHLREFTPTPVSDDELVRITVKELNQRLQGCDRKLITAMKQKRRTLKNRGYALNCRVRRLQTHLQLEAENVALRTEVAYLRQHLQEYQEKLSYYEHFYSNNNSNSSSSGMIPSGTNQHHSGIQFCEHHHGPDTPGSFSPLPDNFILPPDDGEFSDDK